MKILTQSTKKLIELAELYPNGFIFCTVYTSSIVPLGIATEPQEGKFNIPAGLFAQIPQEQANKNSKQTLEIPQRELDSEEREVLLAFLEAKAMNPKYTFSQFHAAFKNIFPETIDWNLVASKIK